MAACAGRDLGRLLRAHGSDANLNSTSIMPVDVDNADLWRRVGVTTADLAQLPQLHQGGLNEETRDSSSSCPPPILFIVVMPCTYWYGDQGWPSASTLAAGATPTPPEGGTRR